MSWKAFNYYYYYLHVVGDEKEQQDWKMALLTI